MRSEILMAQSFDHDVATSNPCRGASNTGFTEGEGFRLTRRAVSLPIDNDNVLLRPECAHDADFLFVLFRSTALAELELMPVADTMKESLVRLQFDSQTI